MAKTKLIVNLTSGRNVCVGELADRPLLRMRGLMGRRGLPAGEGMLLRPAPGIHTAFMRFPIDALFLDRDLQVLDIVEELRPWRIASERRARAVLELAAGESARRGVEVGDRLALHDRKPVHLPSVGQPGASASAQRMSAQQGTLQTPALVPLRPLRVLVISHDGHYRTVMSLLLARRNCSVATTANSNHLAELMAREDVDVVVVDVSRLLDAATATVQAHPRPVGVVLVGEEDASELDDQAALAKWGPFDELLAAIERADQHSQTRGERRERR